MGGFGSTKFGAIGNNIGQNPLDLGNQAANLLKNRGALQEIDQMSLFKVFFNYLLRFFLDALFIIFTSLYVNIRQQFVMLEIFHQL